MKRFAILTLVAVFVLSIAALAAAGEGKDCKDNETKDCQHAKAEAPKVFDAAQAVGAKATCPVMGGSFEIKEDTMHSEHNGKHVYFCCPGCKEKFDADPETYLKQAEKKEENKG